MELKAKKLRKNHGVATVLDNVSFALEKGQKVGLVGYNGTGKTTLLRILAGLTEPDAGEVNVRQGARIGYLPQDVSLTPAESIGDYLRRISGIAALSNQLAEYPHAMSEIERRDGYAFEHRTEVILTGFGLREVPFDRPVHSLSSGQKSKIFLAGVLLAEPDVMLLDEPTNNLDLPALIWLEDYLMRSDAACIVVSHDRLFLDRVVRKIFEIDWQTRSLNVTNGRYSDCLARKEQQRAR